MQLCIMPRLLKHLMQESKVGTVDVKPGGGGALGYLGGRIRSLSKLKNTPKALISGQKSTLILIKR